VSAAAGGSLPTRQPLAPDIVPTPSTAPNSALSAPRTAPREAPTATGAQAAPRVPRGLGLVFLGGLLAFGVAAVSTSSAGTGGHSPSSTTAVTTQAYRLVAPALRWRVRALMERVRPEPLVSPLELPG
jgi:hypothetical protein